MSDTILEMLYFSKNRQVLLDRYQLIFWKNPFWIVEFDSTSFHSESEGLRVEQPLNHYFNF